jgi:hypothetical protein
LYCGRWDTRVNKLNAFFLRIGKRYRGGERGEEEEEDT